MATAWRAISQITVVGSHIARQTTPDTTCWDWRGSGSRAATVELERAVAIGSDGAGRAEALRRHASALALSHGGHWLGRPP